MARPVFTLIIPCHNPDKTIYRLFDSLTRQNISNDILEVVVVDDASDSLDYWEKLKTYGFNTIFTKTDVEIHCPGNTRRKGMEYINGEWVCFADQDDFFEDDAFNKVLKHIEENKNRTIYMISTIMRGYNDQTDVCHTEFAHKQAWLHGKWYCVDTFIKPFDINFKENLVTHEDIYFNALCIAKLFKVHSDWDYLDVYTYRWVDNPDSITRKKTNDRGYLFENFHDYIVSAGDPYWEEACNTHNPVFVNQIMMTILHSYFYYEAASYYEGAEQYIDIAEMIQKYIWEVMDGLKVDADYIVNFVYSDPYKYDKVQEDCKIYSKAFIPKTSFRDFIYYLAQRKEN